MLGSGVDHVPAGQYDDYEPLVPGGPEPLSRHDSSTYNRSGP